MIIFGLNRLEVLNSFVRGLNLDVASDILLAAGSRSTLKRPTSSGGTG